MFHKYLQKYLIDLDFECHKIFNRSQSTPMEGIRGKMARNEKN